MLSAAFFIAAIKHTEGSNVLAEKSRSGRHAVNSLDILLLLYETSGDIFIGIWQKETCRCL